jgi:transcriptional regulator with XRE-family HTH domain
VRIEAGRTQADIAEQAAVPLRVVKQAEQGRRRIVLSEAAAIADTLGCSLEELGEAAAPAPVEPPTMSRPADPRDRARLS